MTAIRMILLWTVICGVVYPLAITGVAQVLFPKQARGSRLMDGGRVTGSELIGQPFEDPHYFWPRPSATPQFPYNAAVSSGSNLGPLHPERQKLMTARREALRAADPGNVAPVPIDLWTASASGLDPHISPEAAAYQAGRVARLRGIPRTRVDDLVRRHTAPRQLGFLGEPSVNVLLLNRDLDRR
jgi:potassium-transporting ATPase KdpC subunit